MHACCLYSFVYLIFQEFHPFLFKQFEGKEHLLTYPTFNAACDNFFSQLEAQKIELKTVQQEKSALKKLENVKKDHETRLVEYTHRSWIVAEFSLIVLGASRQQKVVNVNLSPVRFLGLCYTCFLSSGIFFDLYRYLPIKNGESEILKKNYNVK